MPEKLGPLKLVADVLTSKREEAPVAPTACGPVRGVLKDGVALFRGIPFAAPPVGPRRFLPPAPATPWRGVLDCSRFRDSAIPATEIDPLITRSEDCLYLNIWAPPDAAGAKLPVLVFIHGGGYSEGSPAKLIFDGSRFARDGVVQVNVTYRLNALGFLALEEVEEACGLLGNAGLLDQIAALEWVQKNIAAFGGDAENVTICGESAGAFSVSALLLSPLAKGLFARAILESGNLLGQPMIAPQNKGGRHQALLSGRAFMAGLGARNLAQLQLADPYRIAKASPFYNDMTAKPHYCFWPVFDGRLLPENPYQALHEGAANGVDILAGYNTDEGSLFIPRSITEEDYILLLERIFGDKAFAVWKRYPVGGRHTAAMRARRLAEMGISMGGDIFADELASQGHNVYYYNFNYSLPLLDRIGLGAMHALELIYVFDTVPRLLLRREADAVFKEDIHHRWLNFIRSGDPNKGKVYGAKWPRYTKEEKQTLVLDVQPAVARTPHERHVAFYRKLLWG